MKAALFSGYSCPLSGLKRLISLNCVKGSSIKRKGVLWLFRIREKGYW